MLQMLVFWTPVIKQTQCLLEMYPGGDDNTVRSFPKLAWLN